MILLGKVRPTTESGLKLSLQHEQRLPMGYLPLGVKYNAGPSVVLLVYLLNRL